ncbi:MAG TPA: extracellular solute-binding protein [Bacillota bacterium]|nr:extracellular solute-binding protein [Bacillota bacterium]
MKRWVIVLAAILLMALTGMTAEPVKPTGDPRAIKGGQITISTTEFPKSFNLYVSNSADAALVFGYIYESFAELDPKTKEYQPLLAESWSISLDKKVFTFKMNPKARWADGTPVTTDDVKFTYDTLMNPKNMTSVYRMDLSRFYPPKVINKMTVQFTAKTVHYNNFVALATLIILPRKAFAGKDFNTAFTMNLPPGTGPYYLSDVKEGRYYCLTRRKDYWGQNLPLHIGAYNFDRIRFKVYSNDDTAFEAFKKGDFDLFSENQPKRWIKGTDSVKFKKNWIVKRKIYTYAPEGIRGMVFNMRRPIFKDLRVRQALFCLFNRKDILDKIMFDEFTPLRSYWPSTNVNPTANPAVKFNPAHAKRLLYEAGYTRTDPKGFLINKKGEHMEFTVYYVSDVYEKYLTVYKQDCENAGVKMNLQMLSWASLLKHADEYKFDALIIGWTASIFPDPEQLWHSKHATEVGGSNLAGYKSLEVDRMIDSLHANFDANQRDEVIKKIDAIIYHDTPYVLFWGDNFNWIYYRNIFGMPKTVFSRLGGTSDALTYWWIDRNMVKRLEKAERHNQALPKTPVDVYYDNELKTAITGK